MHISAAASPAVPALELPARASAIVLDLDGTITDSASAITGSIAEALEVCGYPVPDAVNLLRFVGPPIREGFARFSAVAENDLDRVVIEYRARYRPRMAQVPLFPGIAELIRAWHAARIPLGLATAKLQEMAEPILDGAGLTEYFTVIRGATYQDSQELPGVQVKANVVASALAGLAESGADVSGAVMVGDRDHDVHGAAMHGVSAVLVRWGYAEPGEEQSAAAVAEDVEHLARILPPQF
ncbi:HAD hydrolase-like protein [Nesterenkonia ebinurensis]|uniref:HAD hydrolase-like protein n=1 Tax=Nesterenkonia ebinurensis TaxID=2608252 RepID=UPI00123D6EAF|nr:HAD hydrolase-like protein [Nesterenkonia ebinurensis]